MYRCDCCGACSKAREPRKLFVVYKDDGNIKREHPVCKDCHRYVSPHYSTLDVLRLVVTGVWRPESLPAPVLVPAKVPAAPKRRGPLSCDECGRPALESGNRTRPLCYFHCKSH